MHMVEKGIEEPPDDLDDHLLDRIWDEEAEESTAVDDKQMSEDDAITVYEKPTCSKCREMLKLLRDEGIDYTKVNYYLEPLSEDKLRDLLRKMKLAPRDIMRKGEAIYRELELGKHEFTDDELIAIMAKNPDLIQRPIVERGNRAVLGRPTENVREIL